MLKLSSSLIQVPVVYKQVSSSLIQVLSCLSYKLFRHGIIPLALILDIKHQTTFNLIK